MFRFDERIEALKQSAQRKGKRSAILNDALALIDEIHRAYQVAWADECNATMALEGRDEQIARLQGIRQDSFDTFDIDPNNGD